MALHGPCPTCIHLVSWLEKPYKGTSAAQRARGRTSLCTEGHFLLVSFIMKPENRSHDLSRFLTERGSSNFAIWLSFSAAAITEIGLEFKHQPESKQCLGRMEWRVLNTEIIIWSPEAVATCIHQFPSTDLGRKLCSVIWTIARE